MTRKISILFMLIFTLASLPVRAQLVSDTTWIAGDHSQLCVVTERKAGIALPADVVITCHGFMSSAEEPLVSNIAREVAEAGLIAVRFDFNGHGRSEGDFSDMTVPNEMKDLEAVIAWVKAQPWCRSVSLHGQSQGGVVAGMVAGQLGYPAIKKLVLTAPAAVLREDAIRGETFGTKYRYWDLPDEGVTLKAGPRSLQLGKNYIQTAVNLDIFPTSWKYDGPVMIMHGTHDTIAPFSYGQMYDTGYKNSTLHLVDGENHGFSGSIPEVAKAAATFFATN